MCAASGVAVAIRRQRMEGEETVDEQRESVPRMVTISVNSATASSEYTTPQSSPYSALSCKDNSFFTAANIATRLQTNPNQFKQLRVKSEGNAAARETATYIVASPLRRSSNLRSRLPIDLFLIDLSAEMRPARSRVDGKGREECKAIASILSFAPSRFGANEAGVEERRSENAFLVQTAFERQEW